MSMLAQLPRVPAGCNGESCGQPLALLVSGLPLELVEPLLSLAMSGLSHPGERPAVTGNEQQAQGVRPCAEGSHSSNAHLSGAP